MQQFFAEPSWITESEILIRGAVLNHMKNVLRMRIGEDVWISDGKALHNYSFLAVTDTHSP